MTDNIFNLPIIRVKKDTVEMTWKDFEEVLNLFNEQEAIPIEWIKEQIYLYDNAIHPREVSVDGVEAIKCLLGLIEDWRNENGKIYTACDNK